MGAVVRTGTGRKRLYAVAERLYSIYYKLRRERDEGTMVQNLVRFMTVFYFHHRANTVCDLVAERYGASSATETPDVCGIVAGEPRGCR